MNTIVLNLLEAVLTLYPANGAGEPVLASPIWTGAAAESLTVRDRWVTVETRPTGAPYPKRHPLVPQYEISIGRVWSLQQLPAPAPAGSGLDGPVIGGRDLFVLDVVWVDGESSAEGRGAVWHRETFYNVTIGERSRSSRTIDEGFQDDQVFDAEYANTDGGVGAPPALSATLPLTVKFTASEPVALYKYDPVTRNFTEASAGVSSGRATIAYNPGDQSGTLDITMAGEDAPALSLMADGTMEVPDLHETSPDNGQAPRVEFFYGNRRVAALTSLGLYSGGFKAQGSVPSGNGRFVLASGGVAQGSIEAAGAVGGKFKVFVPTDVSGLKLWVRGESVAAVTPLDGARLPVWSDLSGLGNDLVQTWLGGTGNYSPQYIARPVLDVSTQVGFANQPRKAQGAVSFNKRRGSPIITPIESFMATAAGAVNTDVFCVFCVVMPMQFTLAPTGLPTGGGDEEDFVSSGTISSGRTGNEFLLGLTGDRRLKGRFWTSGGATEIDAVSAGPVYPDYRPAWILAEMEVTSTQLIVRLNGVTQATTALSGSKNGAVKPVVCGGRELSAPYVASAACEGALQGYMRALVVYQGAVSAGDKARVRKYLSRYL